MKDRLLVAIVGPSGSGKTSITKNLANFYHNKSISTDVLSQDNYYLDTSHLSAEENAKLNFDHPDQIDFALLAKHLAALKQGEDIDMPVYDMSTGKRLPHTVKFSPKKLIFVEGILLLSSDELVKQFDYIIYVDTPLDICLQRRIKRDFKNKAVMDYTLANYHTKIEPMAQQYIIGRKHLADLVVTNSLQKPLDPTPVIWRINAKFDLARDYKGERRLNLFPAKKTHRRYVDKAFFNIENETKDGNTLVFKKI